MSIGEDSGQGIGAAPVKDEDVGFVVKYDTTTRVLISSGRFESNGRTYTLLADTPHTLTTLSTAFAFHYIYISNASVGFVPTFVDSTTQPIFDPIRQGWYNGNDRLIGVIVSEAGPSEITYFDTEITGSRKIESYYAGDTFTVMALNFNPTGVWQTPTVDGSAVSPVNATKLRLKMFNTDFTTDVALFACSQEYAALHTGITQCGSLQYRGFASVGLLGDVTLGPSRNIKIAGFDNDENALNVVAVGFSYER